MSDNGRVQKMPNPSNRRLNPHSKKLAEVLEAQAKIGAPLHETALLLGVGIDTFRDTVLGHPHLQRIIATARAEGNAELRQAQHNLALDEGNRNQAVMLIWLGKNRLGQRDNEIPPPEPIPGIEETTEVATFADLIAADAATGGATTDEGPRELPSGTLNPRFLVVDTDAKEQKAEARRVAEEEQEAEAEEHQTVQAPVKRKPTVI